MVENTSVVRLYRSRYSLFLLYYSEILKLLQLILKGLLCLRGYSQKKNPF